MVALGPRCKRASSSRRREFGVPGTVASGEVARARAEVRDGLRHGRGVAMRASWARAVVTATALAFGVGVLAVLLGAATGAAVALAVVMAGMAAARWYKDLPPRTSPPDATARRWQAIADGERHSAKALRQLVRHGWTVIHDPVLGDGQSLGQIVIGPTGIAALHSCVFWSALAANSSGVWTREAPIDLSACVETARAVSEVVAQELAWPGVRVMPVLVAHGGSVPLGGWHVAGVDVVPGSHLASYLQRLRLARFDPGTMSQVRHALLARLDIAGERAEDCGVGYLRDQT